MHERWRAFALRLRVVKNIMSLGGGVKSPRTSSAKYREVGGRRLVSWREKTRRRKGGMKGNAEGGVHEAIIATKAGTGSSGCGSWGGEKHERIA